MASHRMAPESRLELPPRTWLRLSGMGPERAGRAALELLEAGAECLVSWGIAGGLDPRLPSGTLLLPERIVAAKTELSYPSDSAWRERLRAHIHEALPINTDPLLSVNAPITSPSHKASLFSTGGAGVDMESLAIARVAAEAGVPFLAIRAIADPAHATLPLTASAAMDESGRSRPLALLAALAANGGRDITPLIRLARDTSRASRTLRAVHRLTGNALMAP